MTTMEEALDFKDLSRRMHGARVGAEDRAVGPADRPRLAPTSSTRSRSTPTGTQMPINQVATINVPEPRMLSVQVWDKSLAGAVDRAIRDANLGLNPIMEGTLLRIPIPELNAERRQEMVKVGAQICRAGAHCRPPCPPRRHGHLKKLEKDGHHSHDDTRAQSEKLQELTDSTIKEIDEMLAAKEREIIQV